MSFTIHIDPTVNCIFYRFYGAYETGLRERSVVDAINHPDFKSGMNVLRDIRDQRFPSDLAYKSIAKEAQHLMRKYDLILGVCRWATIVANAQDYAKVHQFNVTGRLRTDQVERKPFHDIEKAKEWLGIPADYQINYPEHV